jgi:hypothetical protein
MAIHILGDNAPEGQSVGSSATELVGLHGVAVAQAANITTQATSATTLTDGTIVVRMNQLVVKVNSILTALRNKGILAAS